MTRPYGAHCLTGIGLLPSGRVFMEIHYYFGKNFLASGETEPLDATAQTVFAFDLLKQKPAPSSMERAC